MAETVAAVDAEIEALPVALRARLLRLLDVVERAGLEAIPVQRAKHLEGKLWELHVRAEGGVARGICMTAPGLRVVVPHVSAKNSCKHPAPGTREGAATKETGNTRTSLK